VASAAESSAPLLANDFVRHKDTLQRTRRTYQLALIAVVVVALAVIGFQQWLLQRQVRVRQRAMVVRERTASHTLDSLTASLAKKDSAIASLTSPTTHVINLINYSSREPLARMFWDQRSGVWMMVSYHLRQPKPDMTFQLWIETTTGPAISAGTFTPDANGASIVYATHPVNPDALIRVAVSEEPIGGSQTPTGPIVIAGR
jgi:anti-sigma-K factor RskA